MLVHSKWIFGFNGRSCPKFASATWCHRRHTLSQGAKAPIKGEQPTFRKINVISQSADMHRCQDTSAIRMTTCRQHGPVLTSLNLHSAGTGSRFRMCCRTPSGRCSHTFPGSLP